MAQSPTPSTNRNSASVSADTFGESVMSHSDSRVCERTEEVEPEHEQAARLDMGHHHMEGEQVRSPQMSVPSHSSPNGRGPARREIVSSAAPSYVPSFAEDTASDGYTGSVATGSVGNSIATSHMHPPSSDGGPSSPQRPRRGSLAPSEIRSSNARRKASLSQQQEHALKHHIFEVADTDGDGEISAYELHEAFLNMGKRIALSDLLTIVHEVLQQEGFGETSGLGTSSSVTSSAGGSLHSGGLRSFRTSAAIKSASKTKVNFHQFVLITTLMQNQVRLEAFGGKTDLSEDHVEGARHVHNFMPDSAARWYWSVGVVVATTYMWIAVGLQLVWPDKAEKLYVGMLTTDIIAWAVMVIDVMINLTTIVSRQKAFTKELVDDRDELIRINIRTIWFYVDLIAAMPFFFLGLWYNSRLMVDLARWLSVLRLVKILRLGGMFGTITFIETVTPSNIERYFLVAPPLVATSHFICLVHVTAIGFMAFDAHRSYASAVYEALYFYSTVGLGNREPQGLGEYWYLIFVIVVAMFVNAMVISNAIEFMRRGDIQSHRREKMLQLDAVLGFFELPPGLADEVRMIQFYLTQYNLIETHKDLIETLPDDIQQNLRLFERVRAVALVPFFADAVAGVRLGLAQLLQSVSFPPASTIIAFGEEGAEMYFISYGFVDVYSEHWAYLTTLKQGAYFGEVALLAADSRRKATIQSLSYCFLFVLYASDFLELVDRFPKFRARLEATARLRMAGTKRASLEGEKHRQSVTHVGPGSLAPPVMPGTDASASDSAKLMLPSETMNNVDPNEQDAFYEPSPAEQALIPPIEIESSSPQGTTVVLNVDAPPAEEEFNSAEEYFAAAAKFEADMSCGWDEDTMRQVVMSSKAPPAEATPAMSDLSDTTPRRESLFLEPHMDSFQVNDAASSSSFSGRHDDRRGSGHSMYSRADRRGSVMSMQSLRAPQAHHHASSGRLSRQNTLGSIFNPHQMQSSGQSLNRFHDFVADDTKSVVSRQSGGRTPQAPSIGSPGARGAIERIAGAGFTDTLAPVPDYDTAATSSEKDEEDLVLLALATLEDAAEIVAQLESMGILEKHANIAT